jgi:hypothetical protein
MRSRLENREVESGESVRERSSMCRTRDLAGVLGSIHRDGEELLRHASSAIDLSPPALAEMEKIFGRRYVPAASNSGLSLQSA